MIYKRVFSDLWDSSLESASLNLTDEIEKLQYFIRNMKPSDHKILLYETKEAKLKVLLHYFNHALENQEAAIYVCSELSVEDIKDAMNNFGINVKRHERDGSLRIIDYTKHFIIDGHFDITNTLRLWQNYSNETKLNGFKTLRVAADTFCFFKHNLIKELVEYEKTLHKQIANMISIHNYKADQLSNPNNPVNVYAEITKNHGNVLFTWIDKDLGRIAIS
jgi:hypothetical protein